MSASTRIYVVRPKKQPAEGADGRRLVRAGHPSQVALHLAQDNVIEVAGQDELVQLAAAGCPVEDYKARAAE